MNKISIVIPIYQTNRHLDICLLSILGQDTLTSFDVVCVPVGNGDYHIGSWATSDKRVVFTQPKNNLFDALRFGINTAQGRYVLFMNQTDTLSDISNLIEALSHAEQTEAQVLLASRKQRLDFNAFSNTESFSPRTELLPTQDLSQPFTPQQIGINTIVLSLPTLFGNIYSRNYLSALFQQPHPFCNAGDLVMSQVALMRAKRISLTPIAIVESRYEECHHPFVTAEELSSAESTLALQTAITLSPHKAKKVARNLIVMYLAHIISSLHPYSRFREAAYYYKDICRKFTDPVVSDYTRYTYGSWTYLSSIAEADDETLIEIYSLPQRGVVFEGYITR